MDFPVTGIDGLDGKVKVKTKMDACPDPQGKVTVDIEIESKVSVTGKPGTGGTIRAKNRYTRYLDDDAHLINGEGGSESENRIQISASGEGGDKFADVGGSFARNGTAMSRNFGESGFSPFRPAEAKQAQAAIDGIGNFLNMMAEIMLRGIGKDAPWESGHCVKLDVRVNPEKRKGAKPNTQYLLFAEPKAKSDGMPTGGTVKATLKGASKLSPTDKVKAVAKFDYTNPGEEEQSASIDFEARSKRGVGRATLEFDTKKGGYRIALDNGKDKLWLMELWGMRSDYPARLLMEAARKTTSEWCSQSLLMCQRLDQRMKSEKGIDSEGELKLLLMRLAQGK